jgi:hypothetical protein
MAAQTPSIELSLRYSREWVASSIFQGERLTALLTAQLAAGPDPTKWTPEEWSAFNRANRLGEDQIVEDLEGFFFVCALARARGWLKLAAAWHPIEAAVNAFLDATPHVVDVRDMRVHEDEYLGGGGRNAARYEIPITSGMTATAHSIVVRGNDEYLIGGRVDLARTLGALRRLEPVLVDARKQQAAPVPASK